MRKITYKNFDITFSAITTKAFKNGKHSTRRRKERHECIFWYRKNDFIDLFKICLKNNNAIFPNIENISLLTEKEHADMIKIAEIYEEKFNVKLDKSKLQKGYKYSSEDLELDDFWDEEFESLF